MTHQDEICFKDKIQSNHSCVASNDGSMYPKIGFEDSRYLNQVSEFRVRGICKQMKKMLRPTHLSTSWRHLKKTEIILGSTQNHHYIVASLSFMIFFPSLQPFFFWFRPWVHQSTCHYSPHPDFCGATRTG